MKRIKNFVLCWLGWWLFSSAIVTLSRAVYTYATGNQVVQLGFDVPQAMFVATVVSLFLTIWWFLVIKK